VTTAQLNAGLATKQAAATAATDAEVEVVRSVLQSAVDSKQDSSTAATDAEVETIRQALLTAVGLKQDSATAATDAEVAVIQSALQTSINAKQDASTAATDAEVEAIRATLAVLVAANTTAIGTKQDASTAATDTELATGLALQVKAWAPNTSYPAGTWVITPAGYPAQKIADGVSGATYNPTLWVEYGGGKEIAVAYCDASGSFTPTNNTQQDVIQTNGALWQIQVPANSGGIDLGIEGAVVTLVTGTNAASLSQRTTLYIVDELNTTIAVWQEVYYGNGASQSPTRNLTLLVPIPNNTSDKTYRVQMQVQRIGTLSATGSLNAGGLFQKPALRAVRR
jgi:hypothetical protein